MLHDGRTMPVNDLNLSLLRRVRLVWLALCLFAVALVGCDDEQPDKTTDTTGTPDLVGDDTMVEPDTIDQDVDATEPDAEDTVDTADTDDTSGGDTTEVEDGTSTPDTIEDVERDEESDQAEDVTPGCGRGMISGRVCSPSGSDWLSNVQVTVETVDCDGTPTVIQDFTDANGFYDLPNVPEGTHTLVIETGSFTTYVNGVRVDAGKVTDLTGSATKTCIDRRAAEIAVLTGVFDHVQSLLDGLGITYDLYEGDSADINPNPTRTGYQLLQNRNELLQYDILIINSGEWYRLFQDPDRATELDIMRANLDAYVQNGGSIFVTDWAYYWIESVFPGAIQFYGDPPPDGSGVYQPGEEGPAKVGKLDPNVPATVESEVFRTVIGNTMSVNFNWAAWVVATGANFQSEVHILATQAPIYQAPFVQQNAPLVVSYKPTPTSGTLFFSAFHAAVQPTTQMEDVLRFIVFQL